MTASELRELTNASREENEAPGQCPMVTLLKQHVRSAAASGADHLEWPEDHIHADTIHELRGQGIDVAPVGMVDVEVEVGMFRTRFVRKRMRSPNVRLSW